MIPDPKKPFKVKTDASNASYSAILFQKDKNSKAYLVVFLSGAWKDAKIRYYTLD